MSNQENRFTDDAMICPEQPVSVCPDCGSTIKGERPFINNEDVCENDIHSSAEQGTAGYTVVYSHQQCSASFSTGIDGSITAGWGKLDDNGYWEVPCEECTAIANKRWNEIADLRRQLAERDAVIEKINKAFTKLDRAIVDEFGEDHEFQDDAWAVAQRELKSLFEAEKEKKA